MAVTASSGTGFTPTTDDAPRPPAGRARSRRAWLAGALVVAALGFLVVRGLGDATMYFKTVDEAVKQREQLGDRRFRLEGSVVPGSVAQAGGAVGFQLRGASGATVDVAHRGDPPELFQPGIPVVLEGRWDGEGYASDRILVKHTSEYRAEHPDRVDRYVGKGTKADEAGPPGGR